VLEAFDGAIEAGFHRAGADAEVIRGVGDAEVKMESTDDDRPKTHRKICDCSVQSRISNPQYGGLEGLIRRS
jgi:hypothetical protein